jgi:hypothetical protein
MASEDFQICDLSEHPEYARSEVHRAQPDRYRRADQVPNVARGKSGDQHAVAQRVQPRGPKGGVRSRVIPGESRPLTLVEARPRRGRYVCGSADRGLL